jgi:hypothetical protein
LKRLYILFESSWLNIPNLNSFLLISDYVSYNFYRSKHAINHTQLLIPHHVLLSRQHKAKVILFEFSKCIFSFSLELFLNGSANHHKELNWHEVFNHYFCFSFYFYLKLINFDLLDFKNFYQLKYTYLNM